MSVADAPAPPPGAPPRLHGAARDPFARAQEPAAATTSAPRALPPALPLILCWHKVDPRWELGVTRVSPRRFARQVERLARDGWRTLTLGELAACVAGRRAVAPREVVLTFDDGYRALRDHAFPVLAAHGFTAACSLVTDFVGRMNRWDVAYGGRRFAHLSWRDVERWRARGIEFVSHTATHPRLTWLGDGALFAELARSRAAIAAVQGESPATISYPFGAAGAREWRLAREAGYELGLMLPDPWRGDPLAIPRLPIYMWAPPRPGRGLLRHVERLGAIGANRCAVGTTLWRRWTGADAS